MSLRSTIRYLGVIGVFATIVLTALRLLVMTFPWKVVFLPAAIWSGWVIFLIGWFTVVDTLPRMFAWARRKVREDWGP